MAAAPQHEPQDLERRRHGALRTASALAALALAFFAASFAFLSR